jgi:membrane-bound lytic murein transglycosylase D
MKKSAMIPFLALSVLMVALHAGAQAAQDESLYPISGLFTPEIEAFPLVSDAPDICSDEGSQMRDAVFAELFKMKFDSQCTSLAIQPARHASGGGELCEFEGLNAFDFSLVEPKPDTHEPLLVSLGLSEYRLNPLALRSVERNISVLSQNIGGRFALWLARSGKYVRMMKNILREEGIPEDMVWLSLIESGFNTRAYSRSRAAGPWQFIASTGKRYGLTINWWVDERRDPVKSTHAAARYLRDLHEMFDSWSLAMAAYNAGENKIKRAIRRTGSKDYWRLLKTRHIRRETKNYVPKFIAARLIAVNPEQYGLSDIRYHEDFTYDEVVLEHAFSLDVLARCAGTTVDVLKGLNPELRRWSTPPVQRYTLRIPRGTREQFLASLPEVTEGQRLSVKVHRVRPGETVSEIAKKYRVPSQAIVSYNKLTRRGFIRAGQRLLIPVSLRVN